MEEYNNKLAIKYSDKKLEEGVIAEELLEYIDFSVTINGNLVHITLELNDFETKQIDGVNNINLLRSGMEIIRKYCTVLNKIPTLGDMFDIDPEDPNNYNCDDRMETVIFVLRESPFYRIVNGKLSLLLILICEDPYYNHIFYR